MAQIARGMELSQRGKRDAARGILADVWDQIGGENGDPVAPLRAGPRDG